MERGRPRRGRRRWGLSGVQPSRTGHQVQHGDRAKCRRGQGEGRGGSFLGSWGMESRGDVQACAHTGKETGFLKKVLMNGSGRLVG